VVVDVPTPTPSLQQAPPAAAPAPSATPVAQPAAQQAPPREKTCACGPGQRCVKCMSLTETKTGYEQDESTY